MRIEITFKYTTGAVPTMQMHAYDITNNGGLNKIMGVLRRLSEAMEICNPPPKEDKNK